VVVVRVKREIKVVNPGGRDLYIFTEPLAQLTPLEMGYTSRGSDCNRSESEGYEKAYTGDQTRSRRWTKA